MENISPIDPSITNNPHRNGLHLVKGVTSPQQENIANQSTPSHNEAMSDAITRPELDAKLELIETKMDARVDRIESSVTSLIQGSADTKAAITSLKNTVIVTAIGAVLSIVLGVAAFNATVLSNMVASFESGKNTAITVSQAADQVRQTQEQLKSIQERLDSLAKSQDSRQLGK